MYSLLIIYSGGEITQLPQLLLCVCETVQDEAMALIDSTRHMIQKGDTQEDRMETDAPCSVQKDQRDSVSVWVWCLSGWPSSFCKLSREVLNLKVIESI